MNSQQLQSGTVIHGAYSDYRIECVLGQGSFGITYAANVRLKGKLGVIESMAMVAIKEFFLRDVSCRKGSCVVSASDSTLCSDYRRDFLREAQNLSRLDNEHIVKVLETIEENGTVYYVMEYLPGGNLDKYILSHGRLSCRESLDIAIQIGEALGSMHSQHMLHLDLKPLNIMRGGDGHIVLIDFGLSKCFDADGQPESSTRIGQGTTGYAPIEQHNFRKSDGFMPTLDIYALGATLFKMLTGRVPPEASVVLNEGLPVSELSSVGVSPSIIALVGRAMQPLRRMRHQTVGEFMNEARSLLATAPSSVGGSSAGPSSGDAASSGKPSAVGHSVDGPTSPCGVPKNYDGPTHDLNSPMAVSEIIVPRDETTDRRYADREDCPARIEVSWNTRLGYDTKRELRKLLYGMKRVGEWDSHPYGDDGDRVEVYSLGDESFAKVMHIYNNSSTIGYFPQHNLQTALSVVLWLEEMTGLSFRIASESEVVFDGYNPGRKPYFLCFGRLYNGFYLIHKDDIDAPMMIGQENFIKLDSPPKFHADEYAIQIVCDGASPMNNGREFNLRATQTLYDEICPIGNSFYKVRSGGRWNIATYFSPVMPLLPQWHDGISNFSVWHVPGPDPVWGSGFIGVEATDFSGDTYYYKWRGGSFELIAKYDEKERMSREQLT